MTKTKTLCVCEWQAFGVDEIKEILADENEKKAEKIFKELQDFANEKGNFDDRTGNHIFLSPCRKNGKDMLKARNFVGLVQTKSGFCLEILPKTFRAEKFGESIKCSDLKDCKCQVCQAKQILRNMLKTLKNSPFKQSHISNLKTQHLPLLEVFALMFLSELERLIKRGIKSDYVAVEQNRRFLKGKLLFTQNLRHNFAHKERFFTNSDEFIADIAPNRLIKSTLLLLAHLNFSAKTSQKIAQSRFVFDEISPSKNYDKDFAKCVNLVRYQGYENLLLWCKIFLKRQNFLPYQGSQKAFALLFDMNELFESFVVRCLKKTLTNHIVKAQEKAKFLATKGKKDKIDIFQIRPDIVIYDKKETKNPLIIADTKWKILSDNEGKNYGISQNDLYQIFAYLAKYQCQKGILIYPKIDGCEQNATTFTYKAKSNLPNSQTQENSQNQPQSETNNEIQIHFFDCQNPNFPQYLLTDSD